RTASSRVCRSTGRRAAELSAGCLGEARLASPSPSTDQPGLCDGTRVSSIPQQLVDRGFCARRFVDALDDHRAVETRARFAMLSRLAGQRARNDDRMARHLTQKYFSGPAIDDPGRGADETPHEKHRALAHDHAFGTLRARADEEIVFQDARPRLQRLEHAADAGAAGDVTVL